MKPCFDTIVIGSGIGGLTAAAHLANKGLRVLVLERNAHIGGTACIFERRGFSFPMGPLGFGNRKLVSDTLNLLGEGTDFAVQPVDYKIHAFGLSIPISLPFPDLAEKLVLIAPNEKDSITRFFSDMEKIASAMQSPRQAQNQSFLEKISKCSAADYLDDFVTDWRLRRILGSVGTNEPYSSLFMLAAMWDLLANGGIYYPLGGMRSLCERLARAVSKNSAAPGTINLTAEVSRIRIERGKAIGVTLRDGSNIEAASVISNADYKNTFLRMIEPGVIPENWFSAISNAKQTMSNLQVCLGLDASGVDLSAFDESGRVIYRSHRYSDSGCATKPNWASERINPEELACQELEATLWSANDPSLAPEGCACLVIRTETEHSHFLKFRPAPRRRVPEYLQYKNSLAHALIAEVEKLVPGLQQAIQVTDIATPLTYEERGGRSAGAVAGWSWNFEDNRDYMPRELVRTPVRSLYMAGYQAFSSLFLGGIPTAMESGRRAADAVLTGAGPLEEAPFKTGR